jgi:hypothetical protein
MKTVLELDVTPKEREVLLEVLRMMNIPFQDRPDALSETGFEPGGTEAEIREAVLALRGAWKGRFESFEAFRRQAWGGRGVK